MRLKNFYEIKAIDEARARKIIRWYEKTHHDLSIGAGIGIVLTSISLIQLLTIFGNSDDIERGFNQFVDDIFGENEEIEENQLTERGKEKRRKNQHLRKEI